MKRIWKTLGAFVFLAFFSLNATNAFAANPYGINYEGGELLGENDNVQIEPEMIEALSPILTSSAERDVRWSDSLRWKDGYALLNSNCSSVKYIEAWSSDTVSADDGISFDIITDKNVFNIQLENVFIEGDYDLAEGERAVAIVNSKQGVLIGAGYSIYNDVACEDKRTDILSARDLGVKIFVEFRLRIYNLDKSAAFKSRSLFFSIRDIDARQSYKILNEENLLTPERMFAVSAEALQQDSTNPNKRNMYVASGNYIYSGPDNFNIVGGDNHIYIPIDPAVQEEGLRLVFGYSEGGAASTLAYYAFHYRVNYVSDENGVIAGIETERVIADDNPTGSESTPNEKYVFDHWIADVDVTLEDGTEIEAGEEMTPEEVMQVVVNEDITFTAIHDTLRYTVEYISDEHGEITGIDIEKVDPEGNPTGSESDPNDGFEFDHWVADVDVTLEDGKEIKAGEELTPEQVTQVVVDKDMTFIAIHVAAPGSDTPATPNTGIFTGIGIGGKLGIVAGFIAVSLPVAYAVINVTKMIIKKKDVKRF